MKPYPCAIANWSDGPARLLSGGGLVVIRIVAVQSPVQAGNPQGRADSRIGGVLIHQARIMCETDAKVQGQPRGRLVLVFQKQCVRAGPMLLLLVDRKSTRLNSSHLGISYAV